MFNKAKLWINKKFYHDSKGIIICRGCGIMDRRKDTHWSAWSLYGSTIDEMKYPTGLKYYCLLCEKSLSKSFKKIKYA